MIGEKSLKEIDIAVLSDIHSNHIALEACVKYIEERNINNLIFLGDYVSNCAYPEKTMQIIYKLSQEKNCLCIRGNREELLLNHAGCDQYPCGKVINVGSVGTPINETGNAEFVVMHGREQGWKEEFVAVPFDRMKVIQELDESGLVEQSKMFGRMIKDLLLTKKDRWSELLMCAEQICKNEIGSTTDMMEDKYLEQAAEQLGIL